MLSSVQFENPLTSMDDSPHRYPTLSKKRMVKIFYIILENYFLCKKFKLIWPGKFTSNDPCHTQKNFLTQHKIFYYDLRLRFVMVSLSVKDQDCFSLEMKRLYKLWQIAADIGPQSTCIPDKHPTQDWMSEITMISQFYQIFKWTLFIWDILSQFYGAIPFLIKDLFITLWLVSSFIFFIPISMQSNPNVEAGQKILQIIDFYTKYGVKEKREE